MGKKAQTYFTIPLNGFIIAVLFCMAGYNMLLAGLFDNSSRAYARVAQQIPQLEKDVHKISKLSQQICNQKTTDAMGPSSLFSETQTISSNISHRPTFQFVIVDEKSILPDSSCKECVLDNESASDFLNLLRSHPDTLFIYVVSDDVSNIEKCYSGKTKFSNCLFKYINDRFTGNFLCFKKIEEYESPEIYKTVGGRLILTNVSIGPKEYHKIEHCISENSSFGYHF